MKVLRSVLCLAGLAVASVFAQESAVKVEGTWRLAVDTPHGPMPGTLQLKQDGGKLTGTCDIEHLGSMPLVGQLDGKKISFSIEIQGKQKITFLGAVNGDKMGGTTDPEGGNWSATPSGWADANRPAQKTVAGTVTDFKALEIAVRPTMARRPC
jgi:hypothetical protein